MYYAYIRHKGTKHVFIAQFDDTGTIVAVINVPIVPRAYKKYSIQRLVYRSPFAFRSDLSDRFSSDQFESFSPEGK